MVGGTPGGGYEMIGKENVQQFIKGVEYQTNQGGTIFFS